jgi:hypothetical protein
MDDQDLDLIKRLQQFGLNLRSFQIPNILGPFPTPKRQV